MQGLRESIHSSAVTASCMEGGKEEKRRRWEGEWRGEETEARTEGLWRAERVGESESVGHD